jgi:hypothetical protein
MPVDVEAPVLLSDDQMRRYIADGFLKLDSGLAPEFHASIADELAYALRQEHPYLGDNVVPRVPRLADLVESPVIHGALMSLLGPGYTLAPHRFPHNSEPLGDATSNDFDPFTNQPAMGKGSRSGSGWHQDGHSRAGRSRWHTLRAANLFYFPHDTPVEMGPTRLLAGSHLYANLRNVSREQAVMCEMPAGTVLIGDFDIGHAGSPNHTDASRYMVKFVALRMRHPIEASWDHRDSAWQTPDGLITPDHVPQAWTSIWNWLRGAPRNEGIEPLPVGQVPRLLDQMASADQEER